MDRCPGTQTRPCCGVFGAGHVQACLTCEQAKHIFSGLRGRSSETLAAFFADFGIFKLEDALRAREVIGFELSEECLRRAFPTSEDYELCQLLSGVSDDLRSCFTNATRGMQLDAVVVQLFNARMGDNEALVSDVMRTVCEACSTSRLPASLKEMLRRAVGVESLDTYVQAMGLARRKRARINL